MLSEKACNLIYELENAAGDYWGTMNTEDFKSLVKSRVTLEEYIAKLESKLTPEEIEKCLPIAQSTGKPQVWYTKSDVVLAIRNSEALRSDGS